MNWKYFTLNEFTRSRTADKLGFLNNPLQSDIKNMDKLVNNILDPLREEWGSPIIITSGWGKSISQYSKDGKLIKTYNSMTEAAESIGKDFNTFRVSTRRVLRGESKKGLAFGYRWKLN